MKTENTILHESIVKISQACVDLVFFPYHGNLYKGPNPPMPPPKIRPYYYGTINHWFALDCHEIISSSIVGSFFPSQSLAHSDSSSIGSCLIRSVDISTKDGSCRRHHSLRHLTCGETPLFVLAESPKWLSYVSKLGDLQICCQLSNEKNLVVYGI